MNQAVRGAAFALLGLACVAGCSRVSSDQRDARHRHLRRAFEARDVQDIDGAMAWCEKALARDPDLALAHRELALMLDNYRQDYVGALYHYRRYLELRPDAQNREAVEELMRFCRMSFAAQVAETPDELRRRDREEGARAGALLRSRALTEPQYFRFLKEQPAHR
ncbi:MAG: hypothetical protein EOM10_09270, partial [Opitutae bacterium]|nr:hypothetical protein [Opitutae bacterium]